MSTSGRQNAGRPDAMVEGNKSPAGSYEADPLALFFTYCGGSGGGACILPMGVSSVVYDLMLPKRVVYNRRMVFLNREFYGVRIYSNGGPSGPCPNSLGVEQPFYMALSKDGLMTEAEVMAKGVVLSGPLPYEIELKANRIPQPTDPGYLARVFVHLVWGNPGYISSTGITPNRNSLQLVKHDYDIVQ